MGPRAFRAGMQTAEIYRQPLLGPHFLLRPEDDPPPPEVDIQAKMKVLGADGA